MTVSRSDDPLLLCYAFYGETERQDVRPRRLPANLMFFRASGLFAIEAMQMEF